MKIAEYQYGSCFGPYIQQFIERKRSIGFVYEHEEWELKHFHHFCCEKGISEPSLSRELVMEWGQLRENECVVHFPIHAMGRASEVAIL